MGCSLMTHPLSRLAIVNRAEPALRLLRAARDFSLRRQLDIHTIAFYTEPDAQSLYLRRAHSSHCLGPASAYLDYERLRRALIETRATAAWVGWGFVAEHADFAELCASLGVLFIGPDAPAMRALGDKISSKKIAEEARVPVSPWSGGPVRDAGAARSWAEAHGLPLMIKATAGGGGRGVRRVDRMSELEAAFSAATQEAQKAFGNGDVYLERLIENARHAEVQIAADNHGHAWAVGLRDCTLQRKHQKVVEEAPPASIPADVQHEMAAAARRLALRAGYRSLGTVEYLYEPSNKRFYFMEMNARLQVEHPVTEQTTGVDLVMLQLGLALGDTLEGEPPPTRGHAIEARLNVEDATRGFAPAPGRLALCEWPLGPGIRVDAGYAEGETVPDAFDSMIAKIIATGDDREQARIRLLRAIDETRVLVEGGTTNRAFLHTLLSDRDVIADAIDVRWIDRAESARFVTPPRSPELALCFAGIEAYAERRKQQLERFVVSARRGRLELGETDTLELELSLDGKSHPLIVAEAGPRRYEVQIDDTRFFLSVDAHSEHHRVATIAGESVPYVVFRDDSAWVVELEGMTHKLGSTGMNQVRAPGPGLVQSVAVASGDTIAAGEVVCVLEAMKTEAPVRAPRAGRVKRVLVSAGMQVKAGAVLLDIDAEESATGESAPATSFADSRFRRPSEVRLVDWLLGYDTLAGQERADAFVASLERAAPNERFAALCDVLEVAQRLLELYGPLVPLTDGSEREIAADVALLSYVARGSLEAARLAPAFGDRLQAALALYPGEPQIAAIARLERAHERLQRAAGAIARLLDLDRPPREEQSPDARQRFRRGLEAAMALGTERAFDLADAAHRAWFVDVERPVIEGARARQDGRVRERMRVLLENGPKQWPAAELQRIAETPEPLLGLSTRIAHEPHGTRLILELFLRRFYGAVHTIKPIVHGTGRAETSFGEQRVRAACCERQDVLRAFEEAAGDTPSADLIDLIVFSASADAFSDVERALMSTQARCTRVCAVVVDVERGKLHDYRSYEWADGELRAIDAFRGIHPMMTERFELSRLARFDTQRLDAPEDLYVVSAVAKENAADRRLFAFLHHRGPSDAPMTDSGTRELLTRLETQLREAALVMRRAIAKETRRPPMWNRILVYVAQPFLHKTELLAELLSDLAPIFRPLYLERVSFRVRVPDGELSLIDRSITFGFDGKRFVSARFSEPSREPLRPLSPYVQKVLQLRRRGMSYAYEVIALLAPAEVDPLAPAPAGKFEEHDLDPSGDRLVAMQRAPGENTASVVVGIVSNVTEKHPEGMRRVLIVGDASRDMGSLAEPECRRVIAALDLAEQQGLPVEWFPVSSGAAIAMNSGTENLDWTARALRKIVEFTQRGGEINIVVDAINVGAQSYWNAEATMLMHTRGALFMTQQGAMVLTGKRALEFSGGVSAADHQGIGGLERIMGPNGEAQYAARDLPNAIRMLFRYYERTYVAPGEARPRPRPTRDDPARDIARSAYVVATRGHGGDFATIGEVFSDASNAGRKRPFDIRAVMRALIDGDDEPLERFAPMRDAESAVVWDAHVGGHAVSLIGIESRPIERRGFVPADGPERFSGGTLFPLSSKKVARALNAASGKRPVVVLANLSGFDGSPESLRRLQLEYGAEIGRAIVNFRGPIVFSVLSRYHGGAYVVFSKTLNDSLHASALEGSYASVIGGAPAAAVVFTQEVRRRVAEDPRAKGADEAQLEALEREKIQALAEEFDRTHDIARAKRVGSIDEILRASELRAAVIAEIQSEPSAGALAIHSPPLKDLKTPSGDDA